MEMTIWHFLLLLVSAVVGGMVGRILLRNSLARAAGAQELAATTEKATLSERLRSAEEEVRRLRQAAEVADRTLHGFQTQVVDLKESGAGLAAEVAAARRRADELANAVKPVSDERDDLLRSEAGLRSRIAELGKMLEMERAQASRDLALINEAREALGNQFQVLAARILEENSKKFGEQNQTSMTQLLAPLQEKISVFQAKVEEVYVNEGKDRSALAEQVRMLTQLNGTLSQDTKSLTLALTGDRKAQGNWGEIILDDVLERAGLLAGQHYERQGHVKTEDGQEHVIPDVVIRLPGERHLVVDSKMTLPDYRVYASASTDAERADALKRHLVSIRSHMKGLSEKNYQGLYDLKSLDFVVMFVPLEPAFMLAVTNDPELFQNAWEKNVLLVSPSTLLFVVRTVSYLWRQEGLSKNAREISRRGAELYDRLVGFVTELQKVGERLQQAQVSYNDAKRKLSEGNGNVVRQAEMLKLLGVKPSKVLPSRWIDASGAELSDSSDTATGADRP